MAHATQAGMVRRDAAAPTQSVDDVTVSNIHVCKLPMDRFENQGNYQAFVQVRGT